MNAQQENPIPEGTMQPPLPWRARWGSILVEKHETGFRVTLIGEKNCYPQPPEPRTVADTGANVRQAYNAALGRYLEDRGNYEAVRHDSIQFHDEFGYQLVPCTNCATTAAWEYVPKTHPRAICYRKLNG